MNILSECDIYENNSYVFTPAQCSKIQESMILIFDYFDSSLHETGAPLSVHFCIDILIILAISVAV